MTEPVQIQKVQEHNLNWNEINRLIHILMFEVEEGHVLALPQFVRVDFLLKALTEAKKKLKEYAIDEANRYAKGDETFNGVKFSTRTFGGKYDYSGNPAWTTLNKQIKALEEQMKLAAKNPDSAIIDKHTGEEIPPATYKPGSESIELKYPKELAKHLP